VEFTRLLLTQRKMISSILSDHVVISCRMFAAVFSKHKNHWVVSHTKDSQMPWYFCLLNLFFYLFVK